MRRFGKFLGRLLLALVVAGGALWALGPYEHVDTTVKFDKVLTAQTVEAHFAQAEAQVDDIVPGVEKRVIWAGAPKQKTSIAVLYVHGFSASSEEIRPVPDNVAQALSANLVFTRLTGHGRDGLAMATPSVNDWVNDMAEALAAARAVGDRVLILSTSTGGTLSALAALHPDLNAALAGIVFVSPNFQINGPGARLLTLPAIEYWGWLVAGRERGWVPESDAQAMFFTERYPIEAVYPMAALVDHVWALDNSPAKVPALFIYSPEDTVIQPGAVEEFAARWGGPTQLAPQQLLPGSDPTAHVITGDIMSPAMTQPVTDLILDWASD